MGSCLSQSRSDPWLGSGFRDGRGLNGRSARVGFGDALGSAPSFAFASLKTRVIAATAWSAMAFGSVPVNVTPLDGEADGVALGATVGAGLALGEADGVTIVTVVSLPKSFWKNARTKLVWLCLPEFSSLLSSLFWSLSFSSWSSFFAQVLVAWIALLALSRICWSSPSALLMIVRADSPLLSPRMCSRSVWNPLKAVFTVFTASAAA